MDSLVAKSLIGRMQEFGFLRADRNRGSKVQRTHFDKADFTKHFSYGMGQTIAPLSLSRALVCDPMTWSQLDAQFGQRLRPFPNNHRSRHLNKHKRPRHPPLNTTRSDRAARYRRGGVHTTFRV